jgi:hypothetical protein
MSALFWNNSTRDLVEGNPSPLSDLKIVIAAKLQEHGFTDIRRNDLEVAGNKNGCVLSIGHFSRGTPFAFWEVTMCAGPDGPTTQGTRDEAVKVLEDLGTF